MLESNTVFNRITLSEKNHIKLIDLINEELDIKDYSLKYELHFRKNIIKMIGIRFESMIFHDDDNSTYNYIIVDCKKFSYYRIKLEI